MELYIGNKNYSSWSLRPWLLLEKHKLKFQEVKLDLGTKDFYDAIKAVSPTTKVPTLIDDGLVVWESLAICEYINETYLSGEAWPHNNTLRAQARSLSAEMHSGFNALRSAMPMNVRAKRDIVFTESLEKDIRRIEQIFAEQFCQFGGWLFGDWSIVDAMYAPVLLRFQSYGVTLNDEAKGYVKHALDCPALQKWCAMAACEQEIVACNEVGAPASL
ncbi:glutathione S-transferase family protein [Pseudoalteromonas sp. SMS1]|uniref:glutathione S-transferase family protein n=1 Tax=Pseudoalteromonas sp. SMS1 TaxID=2908894 RepID=UPI001F1B8B0A|nr:glutathione S-transferase family protein [Pseudoalteromonas sp. SMS1]MCF2860341.1 glutathione S-transferase family protein [Pseudoalteromonas sp. SMS1]